jgi:DNA-binding NarL/FixJ family response regulator
LSTFGLRRLLRSYADRVSVVDGLADADLVLVDPHLHLNDIADVADLLDTMAEGGVVAYTWASATGLCGPDRLTSARWPLRGWLSKGLDVDTLVDALEQIHAGWYVSLDAPQPMHLLPPVLTASPDTFPLTAREGRIVSLIAEGLTNRQIADCSFMSVTSVKSSLRSAYRKVGVSRRTQAIVWAQEHEQLAASPTVVGRDEHR